MTNDETKDRWKNNVQQETNSKGRTHREGARLKEKRKREGLRSGKRHRIKKSKYDSRKNAD